ncbi:MAG: right-handed parallel beta-helix repeat-containing protein [Pseudomonadota bacterium]
MAVLLVSLVAATVTPGCTQRGTGVGDSEGDSSSDVPSEACSPGETRCSDDGTTAYVCSPEGIDWETLEVCPEGASCLDGQCNCGNCAIRVSGLCSPVGVTTCPQGWKGSDQCICEPVFAESCADDEIVFPDGTCAHVGPDLGASVLGCERDAIGVTRCLPLEGEDCPPGFRQTLVGSCLPVGVDSPCAGGLFGDHTWPEGTIFVDPEGGENGNPGLTPDDPVQSIVFAMNKAPEGGTIALGAGVYDEGFTLAKSLSIRGKCAEEVLLAGNVNSIFPGFATAVQINGETSASISDLSIRVVDVGLIVYSSEDVLVDNIRFVEGDPNGLAMLVGGGKDITVNRCSFGEWPAGDQSGIQAMTGITVQMHPESFVVRDSEFLYTYGAAVKFWGGSGILEGCLFHGIDGMALYVDTHESYGPSTVTLKDTTMVAARGINAMLVGGSLSLERCLIKDPVPMDGAQIVASGSPPAQAALALVSQPSASGDRPTLTVKDSVIIGTTFAGVVASDTSLVFRRNYLGNVQFGANEDSAVGYGVMCGGCPTWVVEGNVFSDVPGHAVDVSLKKAPHAETPVQVVSGNLITASVPEDQPWISSGVAVWESETALVERNLIAVDSNCGVRISGLQSGGQYSTGVASAEVLSNVIVDPQPNTWIDTIDDDAVGEMNLGVMVQYGASAEVRDNLILTNHGPGAAAGIHVLFDASAKVQGNRIADLGSEEETQGTLFGIIAQSESDIDASQNTILARSFNSTGISVHDHGSGSIASNTILGGGEQWDELVGESVLLSSGLGLGLWVAKGSDLQIDGNLIRSFWGTGVAVSQSAATLRHNLVENGRGEADPSNGYSGDGLAVIYGAQVSLCENVFRGNERYGLFFKQAAGTLVGNQIEANGIGLGLDVLHENDVDWEHNIFQENLEQDVSAGLDLIINTEQFPFPGDEEIIISPPPLCE